LRPVRSKPTQRSAIFALAWRPFASRIPIFAITDEAPTLEPTASGSDVIVPEIGAYTGLRAYVLPGVLRSISAISWPCSTFEPSKVRIETSFPDAYGFTSTVESTTISPLVSR
jgi:hypothetical protein